MRRYTVSFIIDIGPLDADSGQDALQQARELLCSGDVDLDLVADDDPWDIRLLDEDDNPIIGGEHVNR